MQYSGDPLLFAATPQAAPFITYKFDVVSRPSAEITNGVTVALMFVTLVAWCCACTYTSSTTRRSSTR